MKRIWIYILLLVTLSACTAPSASGSFLCSKGKELCIKLEAEGPIANDEPVNLIATVTSSQDIQDIGISLSYPVNAVIVENGLQDQSLTMKEFTTWNGGTGAVTSIKAGQSLTFKWQVLLPSGEGIFQVTASVETIQGIHVSNGLDIYQTHEGANIYYPGTKIPVTPGPLPTPDTTLIRGLTPYP